MHMVTIIRHEVGKSALLSALPFAAITSLVLGAASMVLAMPGWMSVLVMVGVFVIGELGTYWGGWSNDQLVRKYVKMVADEQEKVLPMAAAYRAELVEQLRLMDKDPFLVYERMRKQQIEDVKKRHEQSTGERSLDIKLSRTFRELTKDIQLLQFAKKEGAALSPQEVDWLRQHAKKGIEYNDQVTADATKTLTEARSYLGQSS